MEEDGIYFDIFVVKGGKRYNVKEASLKEVTCILTDGLVDTLGSLVTGLEKGTIRDNVPPTPKEIPEAVILGYDAMTLSRQIGCPECKHIFNEHRTQEVILENCNMYIYCPQCNTKLRITSKYGRN